MNKYIIITLNLIQVLGAAINIYRFFKRMFLSWFFWAIVAEWREVEIRTRSVGAASKD